MASTKDSLRDYQLDVLSRLTEAWRTHRSVMVQMPTGTGKTHVLAAVVNEELRIKNEESAGPVNEECGIKNEEPADSGNVVWIVAHRRELVAQIEETIGRYGIGLNSGRVMVMSVQWLARHRGDAGGSPSLVVIDEAHHAQAKTYRTLWEQCPGARFLGLTATPCRMSRSGFTDMFDVLISSWSIAEFIEKGRLSAFDYVSIRANSIEQRLVDSLGKRGADGDYQIKEMNGVLNRRQSIERLYGSVRRFADGKKGIVYAISIDHARQIAEYYSGQGISAVAIDSRTPSAERKRLVEDFKAGKIRVLVNVDVFSEGFDCPDVEFVQMARPTLSLSKYLQQVGRGLRMSKGKETCVLIDNVGLYRVFGLPTAAWDWEAMFCGEQPGKGTRSAGRHNGMHPAPIPEESSTPDAEMELIVSHDRLLSVIDEQKKVCQTPSTKDAELKFWQDEKTGLWGLQRGRKKLTEAEFVSVFDIRYDMAVVRLRNKKIGLVNDAGNIIWERGNFLSAKFARNYFLMVKTPNRKEQYVDLYNLRVYERRPVVKRYGDIELLRIDHVYYSRTQAIYINNQGIEIGDISRRDFYLAIFDSNAPAPYNYAYDNRCGYACLLDGDRESYYWIYRWLADGSIVVRDKSGCYYHAERGKGKVYIGNGGDIYQRDNECRVQIERLAERAKENVRQTEEMREKKRLQILSMFDDAVPFRSGMKWGLKVGERITVPPIYRNVRPPVGKYCAVEKNYSQWGVITLDGRVLIEPQYSELEISTQGIVAGTKITGEKVSVKLP